ncbi:helix-turn-helix transcriptional regulator [Deinococcus alpinitundrae]|uniref:helix-turn-helix transcriptional regulator n=1 Tax=Deinococcus alpinitundrae TaxID=468913 RepID=UPI00137AE379|nr:helix-turn-helix domain-containing protein [Deinococcus alpinitundrae]
MPRQPTEPKYLEVPQAAERLHVSSSLLYREIRAGRFPAVKLGLRLLRVPVAELEKWQAEQLAGRK